MSAIASNSSNTTSQQDVWTAPTEAATSTPVPASHASVAAGIGNAIGSLDAFARSYGEQVEGKAGVQKALDFGRQFINKGYGDDQLKNIGETRKAIADVRDRFDKGQINAEQASKELKSIQTTFVAEAKRVSKEQGVNAEVGRSVHGAGRVGVVALTGLSATAASGGNVFVGFAAAAGAGSLYDAATVAGQGRGPIAPKLDGGQSLGGVAAAALQGEQVGAGDIARGATGSLVDGVGGAFAGQGMLSARAAQVTVRQAAAQAGGHATGLALGGAAAKATTVNAVAQAGASFGVRATGTALDPTLTSADKQERIVQDAGHTVSQLPTQIAFGAVSAHLGVSAQIANSKVLDTGLQLALDGAANAGQTSIDNAVDGKGFGLDRADWAGIAVQTTPGAVQNMAARAEPGASLSDNVDAFDASLRPRPGESTPDYLSRVGVQTSDATLYEFASRHDVQMIERTAGGDPQAILPPASPTNQKLLPPGEERRASTIGRRDSDGVVEEPTTKIVTSINPRNGRVGEALLTHYPPGTMSDLERFKLAATVIGGNNRSYATTNSHLLGATMDNTHVLSVKRAPDQAFGAVSTITFNSDRAIDSGMPLNSAYWGQVVGGAKDPNFFYDPARRARAEADALAQDPSNPLAPLPHSKTPMTESELAMSTGGAVAFMLPEAISMSKERGQDRLFFYTTDPDNIIGYSGIAQAQLDEGNITDWRMTTQSTSDGKVGFNYELYLSDDRAPPGSARPRTRDEVEIPPPPAIELPPAGERGDGTVGAMRADDEPASEPPPWDATDLSGQSFEQFIERAQAARNSEVFVWRDPEDGTVHKKHGEVTLALPPAEDRAQQPDTWRHPLERATITLGQAPNIGGSRERPGYAPTAREEIIDPLDVPRSYESGGLGRAPAEGSMILPTGSLTERVSTAYDGATGVLRAYDRFNDALIARANPTHWIPPRSSVETREEAAVRHAGPPPAPQPSLLDRAAKTAADAVNEAAGVIPRTFNATETPQQKWATDVIAAVTTPATNAIRAAQDVVFNPITQRLAMAGAQVGLLNFGGNVATGDYHVYVNTKNTDVPEIARVMNLPPDGNFTGVTLDPEAPIDNFIGAGYRLPSDATDWSVRESTIDRFQAQSGGTANPAYLRTNIARFTEGTVGFNFGDDNLGVRGLANLTVGGAAGNPPYLTTGDAGDKRVPAAGIGQSIAPIQTTAVFGVVTGPVMPAARVAAGQSGEVATNRTTAGLKVKLGDYQFGGPAVLTNPAWKGSPEAAALDGALGKPPLQEAFRFPVDDPTIEGLSRPEPEFEATTSGPTAVERRADATPVLENGELTAVRVGGVEIPAAYLGGLPIDALRSPISPVLPPNEGRSDLASRNDNLQLLFGQSPWDVGFSGIQRDDRGAMEIRGGTVDVRNHGNTGTALAEPVYELGIRYGALEPGQRIGSNEQAGQVIDQVLDRALSIDQAMAERGLSSDEFGAAVMRLTNPYDLDFGSAVLRDAQREQSPRADSERPADYEFIRSVYEGRLR